MPALRPFRSMGIRSVQSSDAKALAILPIGQGEILRSAHGPMRCVSLPGTSVTAGAFTSWQFMGPCAFLEHNVAMLGIPHVVMLHYGLSVSPEVGESDLQTAPHAPENLAAFDRAFRAFTLEFGTDGGEWYGANLDTASASTWDPVANVWRQFPGREAAPATPDPAVAPDDNPAGDPAARVDEPLNLNGTRGPQGIVRLFSDERFLQSAQVESIGKGSSGLLSGLFNTVGLNDVVFEDSLMVDTMDRGFAGPGWVILGDYRFQVGPTPGTGVGFALGDESTLSGIEKARNEVLAYLMTGDYTAMQRLLTQDNSDRGDIARSIMFGGDNILESAVNFSGIETPLFGTDVADEAWLRDNWILAGYKGFASVMTPYDLYRAST